LKDFAGFSQEQIDQIISEKKDPTDEGVKAVAELKITVFGQQDKAQFTQ
jgi:hypothetical protein